MTVNHNYYLDLAFQIAEKNLGRTLLYEFVNAFPKSLTSMPVNYGAADILKVTVSFNYDRYIMTRS